MIDTKSENVSSSAKSILINNFLTPKIWQINLKDLSLNIINNETKKKL